MEAVAAADEDDDDDDAVVGAEREAAHCGADGTSLLSSTLSRSSSTTDDGDILHLMPERLSILNTSVGGVDLAERWHFCVW